MTHPLKDLTTRCPDLGTVRTLVQEFAEMLIHRQGDERLEPWLASAEASGISEMHGFADSLRHDIDAVRNGLTMRWNSGAVEGHVNRIKMLKRQMFGRAGQRLLRHRVLLT